MKEEYSANLSLKTHEKRKILLIKYYNDPQNRTSYKFEMALSRLKKLYLFLELKHSEVWAKNKS
jgi:hypothetical protein